MSRLSVVESQFSWPRGDFTEKQRSHQMEGITGVSEAPSQSDWGLEKKITRDFCGRAGSTMSLNFCNLRPQLNLDSAWLRPKSRVKANLFTES